MQSCNLLEIEFCMKGVCPQKHYTCRKVGQRDANLRINRDVRDICTKRKML